MREKYIPSGEGYWYIAGDPSKGFYGLPSEVEKEREGKWKERFFLEEAERKGRVVKALKLIRESGARDICYKVSFLERLGFSKINVRNSRISLREAVNSYPQNINRMYERVIRELREIVRNPSRNSKLAERLDSFQ